MKTTDADIGIIVGRFQVPVLHDAHKELFEDVIKTHSRVHVILGVSPLPTSYNDPLPFELRRQMIEHEYPNIRCYPLLDCEDDEIWVQDLDKLISTIAVNNSVMLYGGRKSFIDVYNKYNHKYKTTELIPSEYVANFSGTNARTLISKELVNSYDFRAGIVWANYNKYPTVYTTVDAIILNPDKDKILLCKKNLYDKKWRFVGGFVNASSIDSYDDMQREVYEETGLKISPLSDDTAFIGERNVKDWRYSSGYDTIRTMLYVVVGVGDPTPNDDIVSLKWFDINEFKYNHYGKILVDPHRDVFDHFQGVIEDTVNKMHKLKNKKEN